MWKKELYRDVESLGSLVFVVIVAARSLVGSHWRFFLSLVLAVVLSYVFWQAIRKLTGVKASSHVSNAMILFIVIGGFYQSIGFTLFTIAVGCLLLYAHAQLRKHKLSEMVWGVVNGAVSAGLGAWITYGYLLPKT